MSKKNSYFITEASNHGYLGTDLVRMVTPMNLKTLNFDDYEPKRLGIKSKEKTVILEYIIPSTQRRFHHFIRLSKYQPLLDISQSINEE